MGLFPRVSHGPPRTLDRCVRITDRGLSSCVAEQVRPFLVARRQGDDRRRGFRGLDYGRALMLLDALEAAGSTDSLRALRACRFHALKGPMHGRYAMTVNDRWRLPFRFRDGNAHDVAIEDYHTG